MLIEAKKLTQQNEQTVVVLLLHCHQVNCAFMKPVEIKEDLCPELQSRL